MSQESGSSTQSRSTRRRSSSAFLSRLLGCFLSVTLSVALVGFFAKDQYGHNVIWIANGLLLAYLLLVPRWRWPAYIAAGAGALLVGSILIGESWQINLLYNFLNLFEIVLGALLLRTRSTQLPRFTDGVFVLRFMVYSVFLGPFVSGVVLAVFTRLVWHQPGLPALLHWLTSVALGVAVTSPTCVALLQPRLRQKLIWKRHWIHLLILVASTLAVFRYAPAPLLVVLYPILVMVLLELGLGWAALSTLFVALVGGWFTIHGLGPLSGPAYSTREPALYLQLLLAGGAFILYSFSVVLEREREARRHLNRIASLHELMTANSRDMILLADFAGTPSYVSPAAQQMVGIRPSELLSCSFVELIHPEDQPKMKAVLQRLRAGEEGAMIEYRSRRASGDYIWMESSLRAIRHGGGAFPSGIMMLARGINERKHVEHELREAYRLMETMAGLDALTGIANRRRFDEYLGKEWRRGLRDRSPLSIILIDVDLFKEFNDAFGHLRGDQCLKEMVEAVLEVVTRPGDLVTRYGGEEFAIILPNTPIEGAVTLAHEVADAVRGRKLPHPQSPTGYVTISAGCAAVVPSHGAQPCVLIELADGALYQAKRAGRNQVCSCS